MKKLELELTEDEATVLEYILVDTIFAADPLKDIDQYGDDMPKDRYGSLKTLREKVLAAISGQPNKAALLLRTFAVEEPKIPQDEANDRERLQRLYAAKEAGLRACQGSCGARTDDC